MTSLPTIAREVLAHHLYNAWCAGECTLGFGYLPKIQRERWLKLADYLHWDAFCREFAQLTENTDGGASIRKDDGGAARSDDTPPSAFIETCWLCGQDGVPCGRGLPCEACRAKLRALLAARKDAR